MASPPALRMPAATASQASALRLEITTLAPSEAMISAAERPMPLLEPVMTATWPVRSNGFFMALDRLPALYVNLLPTPLSAPRFADHNDRPDNPTRTAMGEQRLWEKSYPPGVRWDAPIEMATLAGAVRCLHRRNGRPSRPSSIATARTSYAELRAAVEAVASGLMDLGVGPGTAVALYLPNTPYHPFFFFAALKAAGASCTSRRSMPSASWPTSCKDSGARILVTTNIGFMGAAGAEAARPTGSSTT